MRNRNKYIHTYQRLEPIPPKNVNAGVLNLHSMQRSNSYNYSNNTIMKKLILTAALALGTATAFADTAPAFPGGDAALKEYITNNLKYPATAIDNGIEGVVSVSFTVKKDGSIGSIKIVRMVDPDLESEAIRLVKSMPAWTPATDASGAIDSNATVNIDFVLPD